MSLIATPNLYIPVGAELQDKTDLLTGFCFSLQSQMKDKAVFLEAS